MVDPGQAPSLSQSPPQARSPAAAHFTAQSWVAPFNPLHSAIKDDVHWTFWSCSQTAVINAASTVTSENGVTSRTHRQSPDDPRTAPLMMSSPVAKFNFCQDDAYFFSPGCWRSLQRSCARSNWAVQQGTWLSLALNTGNPNTCSHPIISLYLLPTLTSYDLCSAQHPQCLFRKCAQPRHPSANKAKGSSSHAKCKLHSLMASEAPTAHHWPIAPWSPSSTPKTLLLHCLIFPETPLPCILVPRVSRWQIPCWAGGTATSQVRM